MLKRFSRRELLTATGSALTAAMLAACGANQAAGSPAAATSPQQSQAPTQPEVMAATSAPAQPDGSTDQGPQVLERTPYLQALSATGATVSWKLQNSDVSWLRIGPAGGPLRQIDTAHGKRADAAVTDLQPNTTYEYEVGVGDTPLSQRYSFRSAPGNDAPSFSFLAFGDSGEGNQIQSDIAARMLTLKPDMVIHVGDFVYGDGDLDNRYFQVYSEMLTSTVVFPAIGDNEIELDGGKTFGKAFVLPPNAPTSGSTHAYSFDYGPAHFIALDTETDLKKGTPQYAWLADDLARTQQPWKFVYFHRPVHSVGDDRDNNNIRKAWCPLFERYGVTMVFSGHDHNYQRTEPLREFSTGPGGVVYIITGGGGADLRPVVDDDTTLFAEAVNHVVQVQVEGDTATLSAILADGSVLDKATIQRNGA